MRLQSRTVTFEDAARYAPGAAAALLVAGDQGDVSGGGLRVTAANGTVIVVRAGQWVVRYAPGDAGVMDDGEFQRFFGESGLAV
jgi:hypothetical protein